jgi:hypothetical protein
MSAYKLIKCSIKDKEILLKALTDLGFEPSINETPQPLRGYLNDIRAEMATIIIKKEQINKLYTKASNDLGFNWNEETQQFDMICSEYDEKSNVANIIKQAYTKCVIEEALEKQYFSVESNIDNLKIKKNIKVQIIGKKYI